MGSKIKETWAAQYAIYQQEEELPVIQQNLKEHPKELLNSWVNKRSNFFSFLVVDSVQIINRPPVPLDSLSLNGSIAVKFRIRGPKWQIRKITGWKRPERKKWLNNKRVYA
jgi:hypothetical protein